MPDGQTAPSTKKPFDPNTLWNGVRSLAELRIVTYVGPAKLSVPERDPERDPADLQFAISPPDQISTDAIVTAINLVQGDITNYVPAQFFTGNGQILEFHLKQVVEGKEIVDRNLRLLAEVGKTLVDAFQNRGQTK